MRTLYLDCFSGIAGDMLIGALLNLVPSPEILKNGLKRLTALNTDEYELVIENGLKNGIAGINFDVKVKHGHAHEDEHKHEHGHGHEHMHRHLHDIENMITSSDLSPRVRRESLRAFSLLAEAEARVHGTTPDEVHFHEVGAVDSIIDIVGTFILVDALGWPRVLCSPINVGSGTVQCAHGILPVPAPATEALLHGLPVFSNGSPMERTTPTGAVLAKTLSDGFCALPPGRIVASGFGLGNRTSEDMPNVLRALIIESGAEDGDGLIHEKLTLLECNIDDMNPQDFEPVTERLFNGGALDVWTEPIYMKKGRPAVRFCCLTKPESARELTLAILRETTSQGVRVIETDRERLEWRVEKVSTTLGDLSVKTALLGNTPLRRTPEYDDVKRMSARLGLPMQEIRRRIALEI